MHSRIGCVATLAAMSATIPAPAAARDHTPQEIARIMADCAHVVEVAESSGAGFTHSSGDWKKWLVDYSRAHDVSATRQIDLVQARYRKRARVLGGDEAQKDMLRRARWCDKRLAGL
ncbi:hypothetical protein AAG614_09150 [Citromicrobium bathyomarinum]